MKKSVAVLLTVFNRKDITLKGLSTLYAAMKPVEDKYSFDVYMTNDGCTDGTPEAVKKCFPGVHIINGDGNLYWSGGMRKAWDVASKTHDYDYYLWFNDDAVLYEDALEMMFEPFEKNGENIIISGAFCDNEGKVSYGGRDYKYNLLQPNNMFRKIHYMNGNLVIVPKSVYSKLGMLDALFKHGFGDYDYGLRAIKNDITVYLSKVYVGSCSRHDFDLTPYWNKKNNLFKRVKILYTPRFNPFTEFIFLNRHNGFKKAILVLIKRHVCTLIPSIKNV